MRWMIVTLLLLFCALQYHLWVGEGSLAEEARLTRALEKQQVENDRLRQRNKVLAVEVDALKQDPDALEERARQDLGMIRRGETFYLVTDASSAELSDSDSRDAAGKH